MGPKVVIGAAARGLLDGFRRAVVAASGLTALGAAIAVATIRADVLVTDAETKGIPEGAAGGEREPAPEPCFHCAVSGTPPPIERAAPVD